MLFCFLLPPKEYTSRSSTKCISKLSSDTRASYKGQKLRKAPLSVYILKIAKDGNVYLSLSVSSLHSSWRSAARTSFCWLQAFITGATCRHSKRHATLSARARARLTWFTLRNNYFFFPLSPWFLKSFFYLRTHNFTARFPEKMCSDAVKFFFVSHLFVFDLKVFFSLF